MGSSGNKLRVKNGIVRGVSFGVKLEVKLGVNLILRCKLYVVMGSKPGGKLGSNM